MPIDYGLGAYASQPETRPPLANVEAEGALLGAMMLDNAIIDQASGVLTADDFYEGIHARAFKLMVHLRGTGEAVNPITMRPYYVDEPAIEFIDVDEHGMRKSMWMPHPVYLTRLTGSGAGLLFAGSAIRQIQDMAILRRTRDAALDGIVAIEDTSEEINPAARASDFAAAIMMAAERAATVKVEKASSLMGRVAKRQEELKNGVSVGAVSRTLSDVSDLIGALAPKTYTLIAGRPSMGKSVLAQSFGWGCAVNGHPTLMISQEMSRDALAMRLAADITHAMGEPLDYKKIRKGELSPSELLTLVEAEERLSGIPFDLISPDRATIEEIESIVAMHVAKLARQGKKLEVLIVDYIQIVGTSKKMDPREALNYVSGRLLRLAKRYDMAVIALSQLNRDVEKRPDTRPQLSDLKESGRLEEDADNVLFVWREEYYLERKRPAPDAKDFEAWSIEYNASRGKVELIAGKIRAGEINSRSLKFIGSSQAIRNKGWRPLDIGERSDLI